MSFDWTKPRKRQGTPLVDKAHITVGAIALAFATFSCLPLDSDYWGYAEERLANEDLRFPKVLRTRWGMYAYFTRPICSPLSIEILAEAYDSAGNRVRFVVCDSLDEWSYHPIN
jgi:hypothetical protein